MLRRLAHWFWQQAYLLLPLTFLCWAINIVIGRAVAGHIPPIALAPHPGLRGADDFVLATIFDAFARIEYV